MLTRKMISIFQDVSLILQRVTEEKNFSNKNTACRSKEEMKEIQVVPKEIGHSTIAKWGR